jgi:hypothetical protein
MAHFRLPTVPDGSGLKSDWLELVWKTNEIRPNTFGEPLSIGPWWAGGEVEEYTDARIIPRAPAAAALGFRP